jgi:hypothetical protein
MELLFQIFIDDRQLVGYAVIPSRGIRQAWTPRTTGNFSRS